MPSGLNKLEESLLFMFDYFEISAAKPLQIYLKALEGMDYDWIANRIKNLVLTFTPKYKGHYPSIAEIIKPLFEATESEINSQWELFTKECFRSNPSPEVLTLKEFLGHNFIRRYGESNESESSWFKKEFRELYKDFKKQKVGLLEQMPKNLLQAKEALLLNANEQGLRDSDTSEE